MDFICTTTNKLFIKRLILSIAISITINGCMYIKDVNRMMMQDEQECKNSVNQELSENAQESSNNPISELLSGCGYSSEEIEGFLPGRFHNDKLNKAFLPMNLRKEDALNLTNVSYLFLRAVDTLMSIDHTECEAKAGNSAAKARIEECSDIEKDRKMLTDIIFTLCKKGFDINEAHRVCDEGKERLIFELGCDNTIFMSVISSDRDNTSKPALLLLSDQVKADPFKVDNCGKNALHFLLLKGHREQRPIVDKILQTKTIIDHINDATTDGDTVMHIACARRDEPLIIQLLEKGAKLDIKNKDGRTPIDLLHLSEEKRLDFLIKYLCFSCNSDRHQSLYDVATIDNKIFNSDPSTIEKKIKKD